MLAVDLKGQTLVEVHLTPAVEERLEKLALRQRASAQFVLSNLLANYPTNNGTPACPSTLASAYRLLPVDDLLVAHASKIAAEKGIDLKQVIQGMVEHQLDQVATREGHRVPLQVASLGTLRSTPDGRHAAVQLAAFTRLSTAMKVSASGSIAGDVIPDSRTGAGTCIGSASRSAMKSAIGGTAVW